MNGNDERFFITYDEAVAMLPAGDRIHTFRPGGTFAIIGCAYDRADVLYILRRGKPEIGGKMCTQMNHGLVVGDDLGPLFIETKEAFKMSDASDAWENDLRRRSINNALGALGRPCIPSAAREILEHCERQIKKARARELKAKESK